MSDIITQYAASLFHLSAEMAPYLLLGFLIAGFLKVYIPEKWFSKHFSGRNMKSVVYSTLIGIPLPLCSCGVIPTGISLKKSGASDGATISFLISTPQTGVDSILITYSMMGWPFALIRPFVALITGLFGGWLANFAAKEKKDVELSISSPTANPSSVIKENRFVAMLKYGFIEFMADIAKWLVIGLLLAAFIDVFLPAEFISNYIGNQWIELLFALLISVPLYICATGSVPLAAVLMMKGLSPGAALVLLMAGPATNIATITVIGRSLGVRNLIVYLFSIIIGALAFGMLTNYFFPHDYSSLYIIQKATHIHHDTGFLNIISAIILLLLILYSFFISYFKPLKTDKMEPQANQISIKVEGMNCQHCEANVVRNLSSIEGVENVTADHHSNTVTFFAENPDLERVESVIKSIGYKYIGK